MSSHPLKSVNALASPATAKSFCNVLKVLTPGNKGREFILEKVDTSRRSLLECQEFVHLLWVEM